MSPPSDTNETPDVVVSPKKFPFLNSKVAPAPEEIAVVEMVPNSNSASGGPPRDAPPAPVPKNSVINEIE